MKKTLWLLVIAIIVILNNKWHFFDEQRDYYEWHGMKLSPDPFGIISIIAIIFIGLISLILFWATRPKIKIPKRIDPGYNEKCVVHNWPHNGHSGV